MNGSINRLLNYEWGQVKIKILLMLLLACIAGYWPVSLQLFSLKNDAAMYFLPYRYQISNAIQNGELPFWSPYLYMGFPVHGDMQSGAWNPIVWIISAFSRYNMSVLHFESLLYIFIAGLGMFKLLREFNTNNRNAFAIACCYMFSGFITDSGQFIVWLACAAFIPFVFLYYYRLLFSPGSLNAFRTAVALFMLLVAGYPSFLIYCCYILFAGLIVRIITVHKNNLRVLIGTQALFVLFFIAFSLPALISFSEFLPYYSRGSGVSLNRSMIDPFCLKCITSFIIPFNLSRQDIGFGTDVTMRNAYAGIFSIIFFIAVFTQKTKSIYTFTGVLFVVTLLFTLGNATPVRAFFFHYVPLMNFFRHPSNMRLFSTICLLFTAARGLELFSRNEQIVLRSNSRKIGFFLTGAVVLVIIFFQIISEGMAATKTLAAIPSGFGNWRKDLKTFFFEISFSQTILLVGTLQLIFLLVGGLLNKALYPRYLPLVIALNAACIAQLALPSTFVSQISPSKINRFIEQFPSGFPLPDLKETVKTTQDSAGQPIVYGYSGYYNKKVEIPLSVTTPCMLSSMESFLTDNKEMEKIAQHPVFYFSNPEDSIQVNQFRSNGFIIKTINENENVLNISQNYYKHWAATIDGKPAPILRNNTGFMSLKVTPGTHFVQFEYKPVLIYRALWFSLAVLLISSFYYIFLPFIAALTAISITRSAKGRVNVLSSSIRD